MPETKIIRTEVVVVKQKEVNDYNDIIFHDMEDKLHKLGHKRVGAFGDQIVEGRAVQLGYAEYMNKEYIATAKLVEGKEPIQAKSVPIPSPLKPDHLVKEVQKIGATLDQNEIKNRAVAISYAKDLAVAGKIELTKLKEYADIFLAYIKGE